MKKKLPILITVVLILLVLLALLFPTIYEKYSYGDERADLMGYFSLLEEDEVAIILGDEMLNEKALVRNGVYYLDLNTIHSYFNGRFYLDNSVENEALLIYTTTELSYRVLQGSNVIRTKGAEENAEYPVMLYEDDVCYVAVDYVKRFTEMDYEVFTEPNRMQIYKEWPERTYGKIKKNTQVRYRGGIKSEILTDVAKGEAVTILEETENWYKVKTDDAYIGYVPKKHIGGIHSVVIDRVFTVEEVYYPAREIDYRINMGWHQVFGKGANDNIGSVVSGTNINVISPTWFFLTGNEGKYVCNATSNYVTYAHQQGIDVWAVVDNFNMECNLYEVLKNTEQRDVLIANLISDCKRYGIDGINVDFEQVSPETAQHYIQFIRELSVACHENDLIVSVDNYVPTAYTAFYNRKEQGRFVDYVVIMGYDEHAANSDVAGSVASLGFVDKGISDTLESVEASKVINAIPFYARGWTTKDGDVSAKSYSMSGQSQFVKEHGITVSWDEEMGQYYGENTIDGTTYQIWMENAESLKEKLSVMNKYGIAGVAQWKLGLETKDVWGVIREYTGE